LLPRPRPISSQTVAPLLVAHGRGHGHSLGFGLGPLEPGRLDGVGAWLLLFGAVDFVVGLPLDHGRRGGLEQLRGEERACCDRREGDDQQDEGLLLHQVDWRSAEASRLRPLTSIGRICCQLDAVTPVHLRQSGCKPLLLRDL
jgi:hypothetical protein